MTRLSIRTVEDDAERDHLDQLKCRALALQSEINNVEGFMERICDGGPERADESREGEEGVRIVQSGLRASVLSSSEVMDSRIAYFLLCRKIDHIKKEIGAAGNLQTPSNWDPARDYSLDLEKLRERSESGVGLKIREASRKKLLTILGGAPRTYEVSETALATLKRILDVSREKNLLPELGGNALNSLVSRCVENFRDLAPRGELRVLIAGQVSCLYIPNDIPLPFIRHSWRRPSGVRK